MDSKKWVAIALVLLLTTSTAGAYLAYKSDPPSHQSNQEPTGNVPARYVSEFEAIDVYFRSGTNSHSISETCLYTDDFFNWPSSMYDNDLAVASMYTSMAAFPAVMEQYENSTDNIERLLTDFGMRDIVPNDDFNRKPGQYTIGFIVGMKEITSDGKTSTLLTVAIRGNSYGNEWASNFLFGDGKDSFGHHKGFYDSAVKVLEFIRTYISERSVTGDIKLWFSGYSRAAAVANIAAGILDTSIAKGESFFGEDVNLTKHDLYAYTFATPAGVFYDGTDGYPDPRSSDYNNIKSMILYGDQIPKLLLEDMGFHRYGQDICISDKDGFGYDAKKRDVVAMYNSYGYLQDLDDYFLDDYTQYRLDLSDISDISRIIRENPDGPITDFDIALDIISSGLSSEIGEMGGRQWFCDMFQGKVTNIYSVICGDDNLYSPTSFFSILVEMTIDHGNDHLVQIGMNLIMNDDISHLIEEDVELILKFIGRDTAEAPRISDDISDTLVVLKKILLRGDQEVLDSIISVFVNIESLSVSHSPELYSSWMRVNNAHYRNMGVDGPSTVA